MIICKHHTKNLYLACASILAILFASCSSTKYVPKEDHLYTGAKIKIKGAKLAKPLIAEMSEMIKPAPNSKILGVNARLMAYTPEKVPPEKKGFFGRLKKKFSEEPVLLSHMSLEDDKKRLNKVLFAHGFLRPEIGHEIKEKGKKASVVFNILPGTRYTLDNIFYPQDTTPLGMVIRSSAIKTSLKKGEYFDFDAFRAERVRIDNDVKEKGFYFFIPDYILYKVDSLHEGKADLYLDLIDEMPEQAAKPWQLSDVSIYGDYSMDRDSVVTSQKGKKEKEFSIIDGQTRFKTDLYERAILLKEGQLYQKSLTTITVERLMNLQNFRFVRTVFFPDTTGLTTTMKTRVYLSPAKKRSVRLELSGETKSNNFLGTNVAIRYRNLNLFKGAEILEGNIRAGYDWQVGGQQHSQNFVNITGDISLYVPKILPYFKINTRKNSFMPRTFFTLGAEYEVRPSQYTLRSFNVLTGYSWKVGKTQEHNLRLLNFNAINPSNITPSFDSILNNDPALRASFERQVIIGSQYKYTFNTTFRTNRTFNYIAELQLGSSGNIFSLFSHPAVDTPGAMKLFNVPVAQFIRAQIDLRGYWKLNKKWMLANRIITGSVFSYGNSPVAPYSEQFFIGGSSSLRAFRVRTLGPGSFHTPESVYQANESGEIKVELNSELRYDLWKFLKLAAFADAGNIWFPKDVPNKPGSGLSKGDLFREMAMGAGIGFRFDFSVLVLRFDIATPLRKPWYPEGKRWVFNEIDFGNRVWRQNNLILNIGIGYPF